MVRIVPFACMVNYSYFDELFFMTVGPMVVGLLIFLCGEVSILCKPHNNATDTRNETFEWFLLWLFLIFLASSVTVFRFFHCVDFEYMTADGSTEHPSAWNLLDARRGSRGRVPTRRVPKRR